MGYNLLINGIYWGYITKPLSNLLLTSWDIQVSDNSLHSKGHLTCWVESSSKSMVNLKDFYDHLSSN